MEGIAPGSGRPGKTQTGLVFYSETLTDANMKDQTALNWRAASKLGTEAYGKYLTKLRGKGDRLKLRDLYRMGRPALIRVAENERLVRNCGLLPIDLPAKPEARPTGVIRSRWMER